MTERVDAIAEAIPVSAAPEQEPISSSPAEAEPSVEAAAPTEEATLDAATPAAEATPEPTGDAEPAAEAAVETAAAPAAETAEAAAEPVAASAEAPVAEDTKAEGKPKPVPVPESPEVTTLRTALAAKSAVDGKVFGWNEHGFHVSLVEGKIAAFCPRSEMELKQAKEGSAYLDQTFAFRVLKVQRGGKRVVVSRAEVLREEMSGEIEQLRSTLEVGATFEGTVSSLTDFGAFVDIGGIEGLVHVSEIGHQRVNTPAEVLQLGQQVKVQVLKIEKGGKRLSLSMKALEADPWADVKARFPEGSKVKGKVERTGKFGVIIELEPGLSGLLPAGEITLPPGSSLVRVYPTGREVEVLVGDIDSRRRRISLMLEGSRLEGSRNDFVDYKKRQSDAGSMGTMAAALSRLGLSNAKSE
jgi:ribosomal protein S1